MQGLLEARRADNGLALSDIVAMVSVLEQLVFDESAAGVHWPVMLEILRESVLIFLTRLLALSKFNDAEFGRHFEKWYRLDPKRAKNEKKI